MLSDTTKARIEHELDARTVRVGRGSTVHGRARRRGRGTAAR